MGYDKQRHRSEIDSLFTEMCSCALKAGSSIFPKTRPSSKCLPRWKQEVQPIRERALLWHKIWCDGGRPACGFLFDLRQKTRHEYHLAVKKLKANEMDLRKSSMAERVASHDNTGLWKEIKKLKHSQQVLPASLDGISNPREVASLLGDKYEALYNSVPSDTSLLQNIVKKVKIDISHKEDNDYCVSEDIVNQAINKLKDGKGDGDIGFTSNYVIHSSTYWRQTLARLITSMFIHGYSPQGMLTSTIVSIPKDIHGNMSDSSNYRGIALFNCINKVIDWLILLKYSGMLSSHSLQFGFKKFHSTSLCTAILKDVASHYVNQGSKVYCCLVDASKAFDRVRHDALFQLLYDRGLPPTIINFLVDSYTRQRVRAAWLGEHSETFNVINGVRQGGVLSPVLFTLYMDELIKELEAAGDGCYIGHMFFGALGYADDLTLLAPTVQGLARMLKVCEKFGLQFDIKFNEKKTVCICFSRDKCSLNPSVKFNGEILKWSTEVKHLGNFVQSDLADTKELAFKKNVMVTKANSLIANFKFASHGVKQTLFRAHCCIFYGSQAWDLSAKSKAFNELEVSWRKAARAVLGLPYRTRSHLIPMLLGQDDVHTQLCNRFQTMIRTCTKSENTYLKFLIGYSSQDTIQGHIGKNIKYIKTRPASVVADDHEVQVSLVKELLAIKDGMLSVPFISQIEAEDLLKYSCTY